jgi:hypothetical protein
LRPLEIHENRPSRKVERTARERDLAKGARMGRIDQTPGTVTARK